MQVSQEKQQIIAEIEPVIELLQEIHDRLAALPRSATAARQLSVLISKINSWKLTYEPTDSSVVEDETELDLNSPETRKLLVNLLTTFKGMSNLNGR